MFSKQYFFEVQLHWIAGTRGILSAKDGSGTVYLATAPEFGGQGKPWTPELLFLSSISTCFMTTYLAYARKLHFDISHFTCLANGRIKIVDRKYRFTNVNIYPKVYIGNERLREKAGLAMEKTQKNCLIANSLNIPLNYHSQILVPANSKSIPAEREKHLEKF